MKVTVRAATEADRDALLDLFSRVDEDNPSGQLWGHAPSEAAIYLTPYLSHPTGTVLVASHDEELVGYLAGSQDSSAFPSESERFDAALRDHRVALRPRAARFFARSVRDIALDRLRRRPGPAEPTDPAWPAHLHLNLVPKARGTGAADALMTAWLDLLRKRGVEGCFLQTLEENPRAIRFFARHGFRRQGAVTSVPGLRVEGRRAHQVTMVRDLL